VEGSSLFPMEWSLGLVLKDQALTSIQPGARAILLSSLMLQPS
jgi:hypothetical protein